MGPVDWPVGADGSDDLTPLYDLADLHEHPRAVRVARLHAIAMVHLDHVPVPTRVFSEFDNTGGGCTNLRAPRAGDVDAGVKFPDPAERRPSIAEAGREPPSAGQSAG